MPSVEFFLFYLIIFSPKRKDFSSVSLQFSHQLFSINPSQKSWNKEKESSFSVTHTVFLWIRAKEPYQKERITRKGGIKQTRNFILREEKEPLKYCSYKHLTKGGCWKTIPCCSMFELASPRIPVLSVPIKLYQVFLVISFVNVALNYGQ